MAITNGYITSAEFMAYASPSTSTGGLTTAQVTVIENIIESASRVIDGTTDRTFYARGETKYYDCPDGSELYIDDDDLISVAKITNGDGTEITTANYILKPNNATPKYSVKLKDAATISFQFDTSGNRDRAISISGSWGYSTTAPLDIKEACFEIASQFYHKRFGENQSSETIVTAAGLVITPKDIPASAKSILDQYQRFS